jgi:hypothetical protein
MRVVLLGLVVAAALTATGLSAGGGQSDHSLAQFQCQGTRPNHVVPPAAGFGRAGFNYGNNRLRAHITWKNGRLRAGILPDGGSYATISSDGSIRMKQGWWRGLPAALVVTGRRLDAPAPPLRADIRSGYGEEGFIPIAVIFPAVGCWRVTGKLGSTRLTYVVKVTKLQS